MAFKRDKAYFQSRIQAIQKAIEGTRRDLRRHQDAGSPAKVIEAHEAQIASYDKSLVKARFDLFHLDDDGSFARNLTRNINNRKRRRRYVG